MQRFFLAGLVWLLCLGSVSLYMHLREDVRDHTAAQTAAALAAAQARFDLEATLTFRAQADPFALTVDDAADVGSISLNGEPVMDFSEAAAPGTPLQLRLEGVLDGVNELLVQAAPPGELGVNHAVRVRVFRDGAPMTEATFWSEGGGAVLGTLLFDAVHPGKDRHDH